MLNEVVIFEFNCSVKYVIILIKCKLMSLVFIFLILGNLFLYVLWFFEFGVEKLLDYIF